jgi:hypothetical protein
MTTSIGAIDKDATLAQAEEIGELKMPQPVGFKILITLPKIEEKIGDAGLILAEFRLINDDQVEAVVDDPRGYTRA